MHRNSLTALPQSSKSKAKEILKQVQDYTEYFLYAQEISMEKTYYVYINNK